MSAAASPAPRRGGSAGARRARHGRPGVRAWALAALAAASVAATGRAEDAPPPGLAVRASVEPPVAQIGERVTYRGSILLDQGRYQWLPPEASEDLTWGTPVPRLRHGGKGVPRPDPKKPRVNSGAPDTLTIEIPLQVFRTGTVTLPGLRFQEKAGPTRASMGSPEPPEPPRTFRLPAVTLVVKSVLTARDSTADLRPVRGPFGAPWWERIPWRWVAAVAIVIAGAVAMWLLRRRKRPVLAPAAAGPTAVEVALAELAALRGLHLPAHGRFAEHAFHLTRIARSFLEAIARTPRPGDTTNELLEHLEASGMDPADLDRFADLLRAWDRVKFARASSNPDETRRAEDQVESMVRRHARAPSPASAPVPAATPAEASPQGAA